MKETIIIAGLGNPGKKYQQSRHNIGFRIVDEFAQNQGFSSFNSAPKSLSLAREMSLAGKKILLAKPKTFMNESGRAVKKLLKNYSAKIENIWVVHDDIDLPLSAIKIVQNRGGAGHKGIESIINALGSKNFVRFRVGIKPKKKPLSVNQFVLAKFTKEEEKTIKETVKKTAEAIEFALGQNISKAMAKYNN